MDAQGLHTHIDTDGNLLHGRWFDDLDVFHKGLARACDAQGWYHVDFWGNAAYARRFASVEPFYNGQARVGTVGGGLEVIAEDGTTLHTLRPERHTTLHRLSADMVGFWRTQVIRAGVKLGVFEALPATMEHVATHTGLHADMARRLLRALWELGTVQCDRDTWSVSDTGALLTPQAKDCMAAAASLWGGDHYAQWQSLPEILRHGHRGSGSDYFGDLSSQAAAEYHRAIATYARHDYAALPQALNWSRHRTVLDAGGSSGALLFDLLGQVPNLRGVLLDRPEVIKLTEVPTSLADRTTLASGDLFAPWPASADSILLARVLHDWDDDCALQLLRHARQALEAGGAIYVIEMVQEESHPHGALADLNLLVMTGGRERTLEQWASVFDGAGLALAAVHPLNQIASVMEVVSA